MTSILENAVEAMINGLDNAAANMLDAFINHVLAQRGKSLSVEDADALIAAAQAIIDNVEANSG